MFDTSALVASLARQHPRFAWADELVNTAERPALCAHSLAETYAVLTGSPQLRFPPVVVQQVLEDLSKHFTVLPLRAEDYLVATQRCRDLHLSGGAVYDTLIAQAALQAGAGRLVTLNFKHFQRLGPDVERLLVVPEH